MLPRQGTVHMHCLAQQHKQFHSLKRTQLANYELARQVQSCYVAIQHIQRTSFCVRTHVEEHGINQVLCYELDPFIGSQAGWVRCLGAISKCLCR